MSFTAPYVAQRPDPDTRERRPVLVTDISPTTRIQKAQYIRSAFKWYELDQGRRAFMDWNTPPPLDDLAGLCARCAGKGARFAWLSRRDHRREYPHGLSRDVMAAILRNDSCLTHRRNVATTLMHLCSALGLTALEQEYGRFIRDHLLDSGPAPLTMNEAADAQMAHDHATFLAAAPAPAGDCISTVTLQVEPAPAAPRGGGALRVVQALTPPSAPAAPRGGGATHDVQAMPSLGADSVQALTLPSAGDVAFDDACTAAQDADAYDKTIQGLRASGLAFLETTAAQDVLRMGDDGFEELQLAANAGKLPATLFKRGKVRHHVALRRGLGQLQAFLLHAVRVGAHDGDTKASQRNDWLSACYTSVQSLDDIPADNTSNLIVIGEDNSVHFHMHRNTKTGVAHGAPRVERDLHLKSPLLAATLIKFKRWAAIVSPSPTPALFFFCKQQRNFGQPMTLGAAKALQQALGISCKRARDAVMEEFYPNTHDEQQRADVRADALHGQGIATTHYGAPARRIRQRYAVRGPGPVPLAAVG